jgi:hypothetical protein
MNGIERRISEGRVGDIQCSDILKALNSGKTGSIRKHFSMPRGMSQIW